MTTPRFLQIHTLHSYPAALLNRDDSGLAKRMPFGGAVRTRISSQCLKRHWRVAEDEFALHNIPNAEEAVRSRDIVSRRVMEPLRNANNASEKVFTAVEETFQKGVYGDKGTDRDSRQPLLLGLPEVEFLQKRHRPYAPTTPTTPKPRAQRPRNCSKDSAATSAPFAKLRACPAAWKALSSDAWSHRTRPRTSTPPSTLPTPSRCIRKRAKANYFSVLDDLQGDEDDPGAAHIGDMELTAGLFYGYVVVDLPGLVSNLEGCDAQAWDNADKSLAGKVVEHLVHLIATVSPGAKLGSTAPYAYADLMLIEAGSRQPRSLANAFRTPTQAQTSRAAGALAQYLDKLDNAYGVRETRRVMSLEAFGIPCADRVPLDDLANWASNVFRVENGEN